MDFVPKVLDTRRKILKTFVPNTPRIRPQVIFFRWRHFALPSRSSKDTVCDFNPSSKVTIVKKFGFFLPQYYSEMFFFEAGRKLERFREFKNIGTERK
jgi:hypothetical protein